MDLFVELHLKGRKEIDKELTAFEKRGKAFEESASKFGATYEREAKRATSALKETREEKEKLEKGRINLRTKLVGDRQVRRSLQEMRSSRESLEKGDITLTTTLKNAKETLGDLSEMEGIRTKIDGEKVTITTSLNDKEKVPERLRNLDILRGRLDGADIAMQAKLEGDSQMIERLEAIERDKDELGRTPLVLKTELEGKEATQAGLKQIKEDSADIDGATLTLTTDLKNGEKFIADLEYAEGIKTRVDGDTLVVTAELKGGEQSVATLEALDTYVERVDGEDIDLRVGLSGGTETVTTIQGMASSFKAVREEARATERASEEAAKTLQREIDAAEKEAWQLHAAMEAAKRASEIDLRVNPQGREQARAFFREIEQRKDSLERGGIDLEFNLKGNEHLIAELNKIEGVKASIDGDKIRVHAEFVGGEQAAAQVKAFDSIVERVDGKDVNVKANLSGGAQMTGELAAISAAVNRVDNQTIDIRFDKGITSHIQRMGASLDQLATRIRTIGEVSRTFFAFPAMIAAIGGLVPVATAAGGAVLQLAGALGQSLVGASIAAAGAVGGLVGALGLIAAPLMMNVKAIQDYQQGLDGAASAQRTAESAANSYADAQEAVGDAVDNVARVQEDAARSIEDAEEAVEDARESHEDTVQALIDAEQELADIRDGDEARNQEQAEIDLERARLDVTEAQKDYNEAVKEHGANSTEARDASLDLQEAELQLAEQQEETNEIRKHGSEELRSAIEGVESAREAEQDAAEGVTDAEENLARTREEAARSVADAQKAVAEAQEQAAEAATAMAAAQAAAEEKTVSLTKAQKDLLAAWESFTGAADRAFLPAQNAMARLSIEVLRLAENYLPRLGKASLAVTNALARSFDRFRNLLAEPQEQSAINSILGDLPRLTETAADAAGKLTLILIKLFAASLPYGQMLLETIGGLISRFYEWQSTVEGAQRINEFFASAYGAAEKLGESITNLTLGFVGLFQAMNANGGFERMLNGLVNLTQGFEDLTREGSESHARIVEFMRAAQPTLDALGNLVGEVAKEFLILADNVVRAGQSRGEVGTLADVINSLADSVRPVRKLFEDTFKGLGPAIADIIPDLAELTRAFTGVNGPLAHLVRFIDFALELFNSLPPGVRQNIVTFWALHRVLKILTGGTGFVGAGLALGGFAVNAAQTHAILRLKNGGGLVASVGALAKSLGRIVWPVGVALALGGALLYLYNKSEGFRNAVDDLGTALKDSFKPIVESTRDALDSLAKSLDDIFDADYSSRQSGKSGQPGFESNLGTDPSRMGAGEGSAWQEAGSEFAKQFINAVEAIFRTDGPGDTGWWDSVVNSEGGGTNAGGEFASGFTAELGRELSKWDFWDWFWTLMPFGPAIRELFQSGNIGSMFVTGLKNAIVGRGGLLDIGKTVVGAIGKAIQNAWSGSGGIKQIANAIWKGIEGAFRNVVSGKGGLMDIGRAIVAPFQWAYNKLLGNSIIPDIVNGIQKWFGKLIGIVTKPLGRIRNAWNSAWTNIQKRWQSFKTAVERGWNTFWSGLNRRWQNFKNGLSKAWNDFWSGLNQRWQNFKNGVGQAWNSFWQGLNQKWQAFKSGVVSAWNEFWSSLNKRWQSFKSNVTSAWNDFWSNIRSRWDEFRNSFIPNLQEAWQNARDKIVQPMEEAKKRLEEIWGGIKSFVGNIMKELGLSFTDKDGNPKTTGDPKYRPTRGGPTPPKKDTGGYIKERGVYELAERNPEYVINPAKRRRGSNVPLLAKAADEMGYGLVPSQKKGEDPKVGRRAHGRAHGHDREAYGGGTPGGAAHHNVASNIRSVAEQIASATGTYWNTYPGHGSPGGSNEQNTVDFWGGSQVGTPVSSSQGFKTASMALDKQPPSVLYIIRQGEYWRGGNWQSWPDDPHYDHTHVSWGSGGGAGGGSSSQPNPDQSWFEQYWNKNVKPLYEGYAREMAGGFILRSAAAKISSNKAQDIYSAIDALIPDFIGGSGSGAITPFKGKWATAVGGGPSENRGIGQAAAKEIGWSSQWPAWDELGMRESGWDRFAENPSSGAYGIPQALPPSKLPAAGQKSGGSHAGPQISWMADYIKQRYGDPRGALSFHDNNNWYARGGIANKGLPVRMPRGVEKAFVTVAKAILSFTSTGIGSLGRAPDGGIVGIAGEDGPESIVPLSQRTPEGEYALAVANRRYGVPGFASGGVLGQGWNLVGEDRQLGIGGSAAADALRGAAMWGGAGVGIGGGSGVNAFYRSSGPPGLTTSAGQMSVLGNYKGTAMGVALWAHEIGHALGAGHSSSGIMGATVSAGERPSAEEIDAIRRLHGGPVAAEDSPMHGGGTGNRLPSGGGSIHSNQINLSGGGSASYRSSQGGQSQSGGSGSGLSGMNRPGGRRLPSASQIADGRGLAELNARIQGLTHALIDQGIPISRFGPDADSQLKDGQKEATYRGLADRKGGDLINKAWDKRTRQIGTQGGRRP